MSHDRGPSLASHGREPVESLVPSTGMRPWLVNARVIRLLVVFIVCISTSAFASDAISCRADLSSTEITVADRITLTVTISTDPAFAVEPWIENANALFEEAGWTIVSTTTDAPAIGEGQILHVTRIILEPFLDGTYTIPAITCASVGPNDQQHSTTLPASNIEVRSLLPADEPDQLPLPGVPASDVIPAESDQPLGVLRATPEPSPPGPPVFTIAAIAGLLVVAAFAVLIAAGSLRELKGRERPDVFKNLERRARAVRTFDDLGPVDRALRCVLDVTTDSANGEIRRGADLLDRLERARYCPSQTETDPRDLGKEAVGLARTLRKAAGGVS